MSYEENYERRRSQSYFRTSMDIGMGIFYAAIGSLIIYARSFGKMAIPAIIAYVLGGMMIVGGLFRLYRGIKAVFPERRERSRKS